MNVHKRIARPPEIFHNMQRVEFWNFGKARIFTIFSKTYSCAKSIFHHNMYGVETLLLKFENDLPVFNLTLMMFKNMQTMSSE